MALIVLIVLAGYAALRNSTVQVLIENLTPPELHTPAEPSDRVYLAQNWDPDTAERFHFISQGTQTLPIPLSWLMALEQPEPSVLGLLWPDVKPPFTENGYLRRYGFIPAPASAANPQGLPIGFATTPFQNLAGYSSSTTSVGFTCAACHTGHFIHEDTEYVVNGAPATIDLQLFSNGLGAALGQTLMTSKLPLPNRRFDRFARKVLGHGYSETTRRRLASELASVLNTGADTSDIIDVTEGFGRLDALNRIGNQVFSKNTGRRRNYQAINAPVNFPHIWTSGWFDWVQYDGSIMQPLLRNAGEALGVHAAVNTSAPVDGGRLSNSIPIANLKWIEDSLSGGTAPYPARNFAGLQAPVWPESLPAIDPELARQGAALYSEHCAGCHLPPLDSEDIWSDTYFRRIAYVENDVSRETGDAFLALRILPLDRIGTDPAQAAILTHRTVDTAADSAAGVEALGIDAMICTPSPWSAGGGYGPRLVQVRVTDGPHVSFAFALGALVQQANDRWLNANLVPADTQAAFLGERPNCLRAGAGYKARPLNGIWATAPFLHNGSVPTLDALLRPSDQRPVFVRLGELEFDPVRVGLVQPALTSTTYAPYEAGLFLLDTRQPGNLNSGHSFGATASGDMSGVVGPAFSDTQRSALIEYLKSL